MTTPNPWIFAQPPCCIFFRRIAVFVKLIIAEFVVKGSHFHEVAYRLANCEHNSHISIGDKSDSVVCRVRWWRSGTPVLTERLLPRGNWYRLVLAT